MITISLCMIVKNEEDVLDRCLSSVEKAVDELVIVDTGSVDQTRAIAERHHAKIYEFPGLTILRRRGTMPLIRRPGILFSGWMRMISCLRINLIN